MEILYLGGLKQTVYFDTGRLQGYPLCEIDFFHFLIGSSIRDWSIEMWEVLPQKLVTPKNWLPPKIDFKKMATPKKNVTPKNWSKKIGYPQKNVTPKKRKKCYPKNVGVLYCGGVYYWILEKWRTLLRTGLLKLFEHYLLGKIPVKLGWELGVPPFMGLPPERTLVKKLTKVLSIEWGNDPIHKYQSSSHSSIPYVQHQ